MKDEEREYKNILNILETYYPKKCGFFEKGYQDSKEYKSDVYLKFLFEDRMNFNVVGQIGGSHEDNVLKFKLKADQSLLFRLKEKLLDY